MTEMQAAIGRLQLKKLAEWNRKRRANAMRLAEALSKCAAMTVPLPDAQIQHAFYRLYALVDADSLAAGWNRDRISEEINARGVPCFSGSCPEIYNEQAFEMAGLRPDAPMPNAARLGPRSLAFLVHPTLTNADIERMCDVIQEVMSAATP
jgi:dTDP-4-amino-4,6-dideoxygalactose transaminase